MPKFTFVPRTLVPKEFLPAIGYNAVAYSFMDEALNYVIWKLLGSEDKAGNAVTSKILNITNRTDLARKLLSVSKVLPTSENQKLRSVINDVEKLAGERNRLVHDQFDSFTTKDLGEIGLKRQDSAFCTRQPTMHSRKSIRALGRRMFAAEQQLLDFEDLIWKYRAHEKLVKSGKLPPLRGKLLQPTRKLMKPRHLRAIAIPSPPRSSQA